MKTFKVWIILCIIFGFISESAEAQVSQKLNFKTVNGSKSILDVNCDTTFSRIKTSGLYNLNLLIPCRIDLTVQKDLTFTIPGINYFDLINIPSSFNNSWAAFIMKPVLPDYIITDTVNRNWSNLFLKPTLSTNEYYYHSKKANQSYFSDNILYRITGNIYKAYTETTYPSINKPKK
ncbi:MAG: hypothetical protein NTZ85_02540 [Bacteroidia bacterium]|nr:hypothetical protein [Bacteroidia bacterium]